MMNKKFSKLLEPSDKSRRVAEALHEANKKVGAFGIKATQQSKLGGLSRVFHTSWINRAL